MNIWPQRVIPLRSAVKHMEDSEGWLREDDVSTVREVLATIGISQSDPVLLGGEEGRMLDLIVLGPSAVAGGSLLLRVTNELSGFGPKLRLAVIPCGATGATDRKKLRPHEVGVTLDALEQKLRTALGSVVALPDDDD